MFIIIFAGVRSLPSSPFEAAAIDGAGPLRVFVYVTLPLLRPVIIVAGVLRTIDAARTYDIIYLITKGGPNFTTDLTSMYLERVNFEFFELGYGSALSWIMLVAVLGAIVALIKVTKLDRLLSEKEAV